MKLYDYDRSSASYRVRIALRLKAIRFETLPVHLINHGGEQHQPEYLAINPLALVPTLRENGHVLTQSLAIIEYLDEINPEPPLLPQTPLARAQVRSMASMIACDVHPLNNLRVLQQLRQQFNASEAEVQRWYHGWLEKGFHAFEATLRALNRKKPVCFGSEVSLADICLIPQVYNAKRFNFPLGHYPLIHEIYDYCLTIDAFAKSAPEAESRGEAETKKTRSIV